MRAINIMLVERIVKMSMPHRPVDNRKRRRTVNPCTLRCILLQCAMRAGELVKVEDLAMDLQLSTDTVYDGIRVLEAAGLLENRTGDRPGMRHGRATYEHRDGKRGRELVVNLNRGAKVEP